MSSSAPRTAALSPQAFATLLLLACMMAGNHVAARIAMDHGVDVITAVAVRSTVTALVVALIVVAMRVKVQMNPRQRWMMLLIGTLVALQSAWLYSSVARLPVGLALLAFNAYPLWAAFWAWALYRHRPERAVWPCR
jgi:drug/metabolite transporter (DMT)-like permease